MIVFDPFASLQDWRTSLYRGDVAAVDHFLQTLDASLPAGWTRDREHERNRFRTDRVRCYLFDHAGDAAIRLWLQRVTATRVRGGAVQLLRHPPTGNAERVGQLIAAFGTEHVYPLAKTQGMCVTRPGFGPRSFLTHAAEMQFMRFADTVDGAWPLPESAVAVWDELVQTCLTEQVAIDNGELERWLTDSGWHADVVSAIAERFFAYSEWLAKRLEAMVR